MDPQDSIDTRLNELNEKNEMLDRQAKILIENDLHLRKTYEALEQAYNDLTQDREKISAERNKLAVILSGITDAVVAADLSGNIVSFNHAAQKITGLSEAEVQGKSFAEIVKFFDQDGEVAYTTYSPLRQDGYEGTIYQQNGLKLVCNQKESKVNLMVAQITEGVKVNLGPIITIHDVTEESKLEEMKLDFVSMAAHELRTPLTSLRGYVYIYLRDNAESLNEKQSTILNRISIATERLVSLVENLLNISRIENGTLTIKTEKFDWIENLKGLVQEIQIQARDKAIELTIAEPLPPEVLISADRFRVSEVLSNILANAINYTAREGRVSVGVEVGNGEVITHVTDSGQGIPEEAIPHLFTKFFRVSGSLEQGSKGTGLGLYIAKSIIDMHKGRIWVKSQPGQGSTFSFSLPVAKE